MTRTKTDIIVGHTYEVRPGSVGRCQTVEKYTPHYQKIAQAMGMGGLGPYHLGSGRVTTDPPHIQVTDIRPNGRLSYDILADDGATILDTCAGCYTTTDLVDVTPGLVSAPPAITFASVIIHPEKMEQIRATISQGEKWTTIFDEWGFDQVFEKGTAISMIFHGIPGTGKTLMAQAIADQLKQPLKIVTTGDIRSSEPGGAERTIKEIFSQAQHAYTAKTPVILLFDECDSLLVDREQVGVIIGAEVNALLTAIEHYKGIVIFTTNRLGKLDPALERRITAKIEFVMPDQAERLLIWKRMIPSKAPIAKDVHFDRLAEIPLTGGNIKNCVLNAARKAAYAEQKEITKQNFLDAIREEMVGMQQFAAAFANSSKIPTEFHGESVALAHPALSEDYVEGETGEIAVPPTKKSQRKKVV